ncbi:MAG: chromosomal replication initiator protein DnaA [Candidatus Pacebacteria bacterium]|nr:chromosomal replication initiator protein DnaA [Candidatus Paceibacterota bacterium]
MSKLSAAQIWEAALGELQLSVNKASYDTWLKDTKGLKHQGSLFVIEVPTIFISEWLQSRMSSLIKRTLGNITGRDDLEVQIVIAGNELVPETKEQQVIPKQLELPTRHTFETFVVGDCNRFAFEMAREVGGQYNQKSNPLYLCGGSGTGKTHLLQAICKLARANGFQALLVSAEGLTNAFVRSIQNNKVDEFNEMIRSAGMLLVDDVQFLAGKKKTQENLLYRFNEFYDNGKQVVVAGDAPQHEMDFLNKSLRSRMEGGTTAHLDLADYETRLAILSSKIPEEPKVPREVMEFICRLNIDNIRKLEGCLTSVVNYCRLVTKSAPTLDDAIIALKSMTSSQTCNNLNAKKIIEAVAIHFEITPTDIKSQKRDQKVADARQVACFLIRHATPNTWVQIARSVNRDHSTVMHACSKVEKDDDLLEKARQIRAQLSSVC